MLAVLAMGDLLGTPDIFVGGGAVHNLHELQALLGVFAADG
jgi:hypothetical protein